MTVRFSRREAVRWNVGFDMRGSSHSFASHLFGRYALLQHKSHDAETHNQQRVEHREVNGRKEPVNRERQRDAKQTTNEHPRRSQELDYVREQLQ